MNDFFVVIEQHFEKRNSFNLDRNDTYINCKHYMTHLINGTQLNALAFMILLTISDIFLIFFKLCVSSIHSI